jgi:ribosomal protein S18 acetylase RimI-like enzyme
MSVVRLAAAIGNGETPPPAREKMILLGTGSADTMGRMVISSSSRPPVRRAVADDAAALVRLRAVMLQDMGMSTGPDDPAWHRPARDWFARRLADPGEFAVFVVEDPRFGVVSSAIGTCAAEPDEPGDVQGHVSNISTDPRCRRRGYARACLDALLAWFRDETEATVVNLNATEHMANLYYEIGFRETRFPALELRLERSAPVTVS